MADILGIGECMLELNADGPLQSATQFTRSAGGDVYNTLAAISRLGGSAGFISQIADDDLGHALLARFAQDGVDSRHITRQTNAVNGLYLTALNADRKHQFLYYRQNSAASQLASSQITEAMLENCKLIYGSGITVALSASCHDAVLKAFQLAKANGIKVAYDPNIRPALWRNDLDRARDVLTGILPFVDYLFPSIDDMQLLLGLTTAEEILDYFTQQGISVIALKMGADGVWLRSPGGDTLIPALKPAHLVDTIGAGDAFNGGFLTGVLRDLDWVTCATLGTATASLSLRARGPLDGLPTQAEVDALLAFLARR